MVQRTEKEIKKKLISALKGFSPEIIFPKINNQHTYSVFYDGDIATITKPNGTILRLVACGEIDFNVGERRYRDSGGDFTDKELQDLEEKGELVWDMNNWFEVIYQQKGALGFEGDEGVVVGTYDEGIELLQNYYEDDGY